VRDQGRLDSAFELSVSAPPAQRPTAAVGSATAALQASKLRNDSEKFLKVNTLSTLLNTLFRLLTI
jgi:hypothetical protein